MPSLSSAGLHVSVCCYSRIVEAHFAEVVDGLTLDFGLDIVDSIGGLHLKGDSLTRKGLDEDLHLDEGLMRKKLVGCSQR